MLRNPLRPSSPFGIDLLSKRVIKMYIWKPVSNILPLQQDETLSDSSALDYNFG